MSQLGRCGARLDRTPGAPAVAAEGRTPGQAPCCRSSLRGWSSRSPGRCFAPWDGHPSSDRCHRRQASRRDRSNPRSRREASTSTFWAKRFSAKPRPTVALRATKKLLARPDVDYVSLKVSSTVAPHSPWAYDQAVAHVIRASCCRSYQYAAAQAAQGRRKFINLDMEEYQDLDTTIEVFMKVLDRDEFSGRRGGDRASGISARRARRDDKASGVERAARRARGGLQR